MEFQALVPVPVPAQVEAPALVQARVPVLVRVLVPAQEIYQGNKEPLSLKPNHDNRFLKRSLYKF